MMATEDANKLDYVHFAIRSYDGRPVHVLIDELPRLCISPHGTAEQAQVVRHSRVPPETVHECTYAKESLVVFVELLEGSKCYSDGQHLLGHLLLCCEGVPYPDVACSR